MTKIAFITGITGQDGSYLSELLLNKGYVVHGIIRRSSLINTSRIDHLRDNPNFFTHYGDLTDSSCLNTLIRKILPDEVYNLGAQSHVKVSFEVPEYTADVDAVGHLRLLEACRSAMDEHKGYNPRIYFAATSELYGGVYTTATDENTPFVPRSPYAVAKQYGFWINKEYRTAYNMFCCNGILFNHEGPRRGETFVTRKITKAVVNIKNEKQEFVTLGNIDAHRDWGDSEDYVRAMWMMLQHDTPDDYVVATGETHTVREFVEESFKLIGMNIHWYGKGSEEYGTDDYGNIRVKIDPKYYRPSEVEYLLGNPAKINNVLGWKPKYTFKTLVKRMIDSDLNAVK